MSWSQAGPRSAPSARAPRRAPAALHVACATGLLVAGLHLLAPRVRAQEPAEPRVEARASVEEVSVGEPFVVELRAIGPAGTEWTFPATAGGEDVELALDPSTPAPRMTPEKASPDAAARDAASPAPPADGAAVRRYRAAVFALKDLAVPEMTVRYRLPDGREGEAHTQAVPLRLRSLLPKDPQEQKLADVRPPLALDVGWPFWAALGSGLVLATLAGVLIARRLRPRPAADRAAPPVPPDVEARRALDALAGSDLVARGELRAFYIALAEIAKRYLERRLDAPVLEMTSTEALGFLRGHAHGDPLVAPLRDLMGAADQVKFARGPGQAAEAQRHLEAARGVVQALEARLQPPPDGGAAARPAPGGAR